MDSCIISLNLNCILQLKQFYNIATKVSYRKKCYYFWSSTWLLKRARIFIPLGSNLHGKEGVFPYIGASNASYIVSVNCCCALCGKIPYMLCYIIAIQNFKDGGGKQGSFWVWVQPMRDVTMWRRLSLAEAIPKMIHGYVVWAWPSKNQQWIYDMKSL